MRRAAQWTLLGFALCCCALAAAQDEPVMCYRFTWIAEQNSTDCEKKNEEGIPCFEPFVVTGTGNGDMSNKLPPNITDLVETCKKMNCPSFMCDKDDKQCLQWKQLDIKGNPTYISRFCGSMADTTKINDPKSGNSPPITDECFTNKNGTVTVEACACNTKACNGSSGLQGRLELLFMTVAAVALLSGWMHRP